MEIRTYVTYFGVFSGMVLCGKTNIVCVLSTLPQNPWARRPISLVKNLIQTGLCFDIFSFLYSVVMPVSSSMIYLPIFSDIHAASPVECFFLNFLGDSWL